MALRRLVPSSRQFLKTQTRSLALAVRFHENGAPEKVFKLEQLDSSFVNGKLGEKEVGLKFLAAPINPSDINIAEGTYGIKPKLPAIGGNEGVAVVESVGSDVKNLQVGDWVVPLKGGFGTWTQYQKASEQDLMKVRNDVHPVYPATLSINPSTAYRLLRDFVKLQPGDVIIQNGANSMVGLAVVQFAREMGIRTINVVRKDRPDTARELRLLTNLGGTVNITDDYLNSATLNEILKDLPPVKLGLNCVGGESATNLARALGQGGTLVTYGGMAKKPVTVPFDLLVYKQLKCEGFWIADWYEKHSVEERKAMWDEILQFAKDQRYRHFFQLVDLDDFSWAMEKTLEPYYPRKVVLNIDYPDRFKEHDAIPDSDYWIFNTTGV